MGLRRDQKEKQKNRRRKAKARKARAFEMGSVRLTIGGKELEQVTEIKYEPL